MRSLQACTASTKLPTPWKSSTAKRKVVVERPLFAYYMRVYLPHQGHSTSKSDTYLHTSSTVQDRHSILLASGVSAKPRMWLHVWICPVGTGCLPAKMKPTKQQLHPLATCAGMLIFVKRLIIMSKSPCFIARHEGLRGVWSKKLSHSCCTSNARQKGSGAEQKQSLRLQTKAAAAPRK